MAESLIDEDEDTELLDTPTDLRCVQCGDVIHLTEEIFLLRIVLPFSTASGLMQYDVLNDRGDYKYEPAFFCFSCWEEENEDLQEKQEDVPPVRDSLGVISCDVCHSDVRQGELVGLVEFGELHWSTRSPNFRHTHTFDSLSNDKHICIACIHHLDTSRLQPLWPGEIEPTPGVAVCTEGIFERCWRYGNCTCLNRVCK